MDDTHDFGEGVNHMKLGTSAMLLATSLFRTKAIYPIELNRLLSISNLNDSHRRRHHPLPKNSLNYDALIKAGEHARRAQG